MARFKPGESGNPKGRPPKKRTLTEILEKAGNGAKVYGGGIAPKKLLAELLWQAAATGTVTFPDQTKAVVLEPQDWIGVVKFLYQHIDGPPKQELDVTSNGDSLRFTSEDAVTALKELEAWQAKKSNG